MKRYVYDWVCTFFTVHFILLNSAQILIFSLFMQFDSRISDASAFLQKLQATPSNDSIRCPYLANLEIERRKHLYGKGNDDILIEALLKYFSR